MTKMLERALAEIARLPEADQDRIAQRLLDEVERLRAASPSNDLPPAPLSSADLDKLRAFRAKLPASTTDAGAFMSQMRDEDWR